MRAAMLLGPEEVEVRTVELPRPGTGEVLLRIDAATTCGTDVKVFKRGGHPRMLKTPTLFGHEMAGTVETAGPGVRGVVPGERLVVANSAPCGQCLYCRRDRENLCQDLHYLNGAFAEYILIPERFVQRSLYHIPDSLPAARAALAEPLACVLHGMDACAEGLRGGRDGGARVAVYGGGPMGQLFVACLAREGHHVVLADPNPSRLETGLAMGATHCLQVRRDGQQSAGVRELAGEGLDVAIDCTGQPQAWADALSSVAPGGLVNLFGGCAPGTQVALDTHHVHYSEITVKGVYHHRPATFSRALELLGDVHFPAHLLLSDHRPIDDVTDALRSMMDKHALKVVLSGTVS